MSLLDALEVNELVFEWAMSYDTKVYELSPLVRFVLTNRACLGLGPPQRNSSP